MKRPRPYIPLSVRRTVILRQFAERRPNHAAILADSPMPDAKVIKHVLAFLFGDKKVALDHNPALILRPYNPRIKDPAARYTPNANDPAHLIYREQHDHHIKTNVRGDGAHLSDTSERMKRRRMEENRGLRPRKPKAKIRSRNTFGVRPLKRRAQFGSKSKAWPKRRMRSCKT